MNYIERYEQAQQKLIKIRKTMLVTAFDGGCDVLVYHEDGSSYHFKYAFARTWDVFYLVFTEHNGYHVFFQDDSRVMELTEMHVINLDIKPLTDIEEQKWEDDYNLYRTNQAAWFSQRIKTDG